MKILLVTSHFYPEQFKANDMAFELSRRGHDVTVLTPIPDYPHGRFYKGYGIFKKRREIVNGVKIIRTLIIPRRDGSPLWLFLNYLTHTFFATLKAINIGINEKFDSIVVHETSPITIGIAAMMVRKIQKIPIHFWVLDLWPDSLSAAGGIKNKTILNIFGSITKWIYRHCHTILISSKGFRKSICKLGNFDSRIVYFPNWVDEDEPLSNQEDYFGFPDTFNVLFTGNIGDAQDMPHLLEAARILKNENISFIIVGDGRKRQWVEEYIKDHDLRNVYLPGSFPRDAMQFFYQRADLLFFALKDSPIFSLTAPAKIQAYMSSGKPIVAMINGDGADLIQEANCGWTVAAEDSIALSEIIRRLAKEDKYVLEEKGRNGKVFSDKHFNFKKCIDHLEECIASS